MWIRDRFGGRPWKAETFKFSPDPELVAKVTDVVGLYLAPPENAIVLCVDEKSQIQACLLYTSDAADERSSVDLGGRRIIKKKNSSRHKEQRKKDMKKMMKKGEQFVRMGHATASSL